MAADRPTVLAQVRPGEPAPGAVPPARAPLLRPDGGARLQVTRFELSGNTRWSSEVLRREVLAPFEGRVLTAEALESARRSLTRWYIDHGYLNSGARIPDQSITDGVVRIEIVEGRLTRIDIDGTRHLKPAYLIDRLRPDPDTPLHVGDLADRLRQLQQRPMIDRLRANLGHGSVPGESVLTLDVREAPLWQGGLTIANNRSPSIGPVRAQLFAAARSVTGRGDPLLLRFGLARRLDDIGVDYALPLTANDLTLNVRMDSSDSLVVEAPFSDLDIRSRTRIASVGLTWPFAATADRGHSLGFAFEHKRNQTWLLGERFSLSPGAQDGRSAVTVLRLFHEGFRRSVVEALAVRTSLNLGIDALGATTGPTRPDGRFVSLQGQLQWLRRFEDSGGQLYLRSHFQWTNDSLLALEKIAVGGAATVRGYRENALVRDQALIMSLEWRQSIDRWLRRSPDSMLAGEFQFGPFIDYAVTRNHGTPTPTPRTLGSVGLAARWNLVPYAFAEIAYGRGLRRLSPRGDDLQDKGIHIRVTMQTR